MPALRLRRAADLDRRRNALLDGGIQVELAPDELGERQGELETLDGDALGIFLHHDLQLLFDLQELRAQLRRQLRQHHYTPRSLATDSACAAFGAIVPRSASARM